jgi:hypothetical protein
MASQVIEAGFIQARNLSSSVEIVQELQNYAIKKALPQWRTQVQNRDSYTSRTDIRKLL